MLKLSPYNFVNLVVKLEYNHREQLLLMKTEQLTFILLQPRGDALETWKA